MIDLRSDTLTSPTTQMREVMAQAAVGDDVYGEDPTVNRLEEFAAQLLGMQAALYVSSGTQSNLLGIMAHCGRGDEYIVAQAAHTYRLEGGGAAVLGGIQPQPLDLQADGTFDLDVVAANIKPDNFHFAKTRLLCLENTHAGISLSLDYMQAARSLCDKYSIGLHLDGARFFNAAIDRQLTPKQLAAPFDSISICLSKGLGAPVGSILLGSKEFIKESRRLRKMVGGGMRQAGIIAAGGLHVLTHNIDRLIEDHRNAATIAHTLGELFDHSQVRQATNMVHLDIDPETYKRLRKHLFAHDIKVDRPRWVMHLDVDDADVTRLVSVLQEFSEL